MKRVALIVLLSITAAWGLDKDKGRFAPEPASAYPNHETQEGITIAAVPYTTEEQSKTVFGKAHPYGYGILPVLVVIQNDTGKALRLDLVAKFVTRTGESLEAMPPFDVQRFQGIQRRPGMPTPNPLPIPLPRRKNKAPLNVEEIEGQAWAVELLPPGESAHGFFYFQAADLRDSMLYLSGLRDAATGQAYFYFEVPLD